MRNFVAATCCLIVGLEVLIGVPTAVCLGFLCLDSGAVPGVYVSEAQFDSPTCPPPIYSAPIYCPAPVQAGPYPSAPLPAPFPPAPSVSPSRPDPWAPAVVASLPASDPAANPLPPQPNFAVAIDGPQFLARVCAEENCPAAKTDDRDAEKKTVPERELAESLRVSASLLYEQADRYEADEEYDLADRLRTLARDLRDEASSIRRRLPDYDTPPVAEPWPAAAPAKAEPRTVTVGPPPLG